VSVQQPVFTDPSPGFSVRIRPDRDRVVVALGGELDLATVPRAERWVRELYGRGFTSVALDLRELAFVDSSGLHLLLRLDDLAAADGCRFALVDGGGPIRRLLDLTGMADRFHSAPPPPEQL
jgi:anti-sigma B factor antagonist